MKSVKYDKKKAKEERILRRTRETENRFRENYLKELREDERFQKYVVGEIINNGIKELSDLNKVMDIYRKNGGDIGKKEELADLVINSALLVAKLKSMFKKFL